jgi:Uma2 family endonuclease
MTRMSKPAGLTADDLERLDAVHPRAELWDGVLFVREPASAWHGLVGASVVSALRAHAEPRGLGWVLDASVGFLVSRDPDRVLEPDASYVSLERLPSLPRRGFPALAPDLVVEVRSPETPPADAYAKGLVWLSHGAKVVWLVDPLAPRALVLRPGEPPTVVSEDDALDAAPALDLRLPLARVLPPKGAVLPLE